MPPQTMQRKQRSPAEPVLNNKEFQRRFYLGIGLGRSWLEPDTSEVDGLDVDDRVDLGAQIALGADLKKWLSVELHAATLGDAGLSNGDNVSYDQAGVSALFYAGGARNRFNRRGFTGFGRVGVGVLFTDTDGDVPLDRDNRVHLLGGLGVEFATRSGLALRAEGIVFDADVNYLQLGLLYRFGRRAKRQRDEIISAGPSIASPQPVQSSPASVSDTVVAADDKDRDVVDNATERCSGTAVGLAVDESGCALFNGVIEGLNFNSASAELTPESRKILDDVANTLKTLPTMRFLLAAHTDNVGDAVMNQALSARRARSVAAYLIQAGIPASRFTLQAYGESRPLVTNDTVRKVGRLVRRRSQQIRQRYPRIFAGIFMRCASRANLTVRTTKVSWRSVLGKSMKHRRRSSIKTTFNNCQTFGPIVEKVFTNPALRICDSLAGLEKLPDPWSSFARRMRVRSRRNRIPPDKK